MKIAHCVRVTIAIVTLAALLGGCPAWTDWINQNSVPAGLVRLESADALLAYLQERLAADNAPTNGYFSLVTIPSRSELDRAGIAKSDLFKSDGAHFYIANDNTVRIVNAAPLSELAEVGQVTFDDAVNGIFLSGSKVIVLTGAATSSSLEHVSYEADASTTVYEVDVADPAHPALTAQIKVDGRLATSYLTNGHLVLVLTVVLALPTDAEDASQATLDQLLPTMNRGAGDEPLVAAENWYRPLEPDGACETVVLTLDANRITTVLGSVAILGRLGTVYSSADAAYLTNRPDTLLGATTTIHKLAFNQQDVARPVASGSLPGRLKDWYSLNENGRYLHAVTSVVNETGSTAQGNANLVDSVGGEPPQHAVVSVLTQNGGQLDVVGQIDNISPDQAIYSVRLLGDHGILTRPQVTDPLLILDLSNPTAPRIAGEVTTTGLSNFLYPLGNTHVLGVGEWTIPTDAEPIPCEGIQLALFDVSDWSNPQAQQRIQCGGCGSTSSSYSMDQAFFILGDPTRIALPMFLTSDGTKAATSPYYIPDFRGTLAFRVDTAAGMAELARVEAPGTTAAAPWALPLSWMRAAIIGDTLYSITEQGVAGAPMSDPQQRTEIKLE